jgi:curved DNA-binding protein CbpA
MRSFKTQNYYDILGVTRSATSEEIRSAFEICRHTFQENSLATYSLFSDQENREILSLIAKAFETLFNPESRRSYDALLTQQDGESAPGARRAPPAGAGAFGPPSAGVQAAPHSAAGYGAPRTRPEPEPPRRPGAQTVPPGFAGTEPPRPGPRPFAAQPGAGSQAPPGARHDAPAAGTAGTAPVHAPAAHFAPKPAPVPQTQALNPEREEFLKSVKLFNGAALKKARQMHGMNLVELAERSKIRRAYLEYIEEEQFQFLPAPVYVKGFVTLMASILGLPAERAAQDYMQIFRAKRPNP